ncbi:MAG: NAD(P)H-dependent oxidoreductase subunit E, partial [Christensenellales bacterium]
MMGNEEKYAQLQTVIAENKGRGGAVMRTLQAAQDIFGHVPKDVQIQIADGLGETLSEVYGVATFYSQFALEPRGEYTIGVCMGTACYVKNAQSVLDRVCSSLDVKPGETTPDALFTVKDTRCLGA